jgi:hypothetical protein
MVERQVKGFHYSAIPTAEYRTRFGFLSYACARGTAVFFLNPHQPAAIPRDKVVATLVGDGFPRSLPQPILDAGRVELTAVIHPRSAGYNFWVPPDRLKHKVYWPSESGGQATLQKIFQRCYEMTQPEYKEERNARYVKTIELLRACRTTEEARNVDERQSVDPILSELMEPERMRQKTEMLKAIDRVCTL